MSILHLDKKFREDAAERLLAIYDATIRYSGLANSVRNSDNTDLDYEEKDEVLDSADGAAPKPPPKPRTNEEKVSLMSGERVVFAHELRPNQGFRILVTGEVDAAMVKALEAFAAFQKMLAAQTPPSDNSDLIQ
ncbi:MAG: hypothetical protein JNJ55_01585 [Betaproteobacteria bacterium]|nr:hypothetical protein [Betaproteobacteria bacterium]